jgi:hypothetical protein
VSTNAESPDPDRIALGVQQPWAELIVRGVKTIEVRSQPTQVRGTIYIYASRKVSTIDTALTTAAAQHIDVAALPKGLLVGTVEIVDSRPCTPADAVATCVPANLLAGHQAWVLANPQRLAKPLPVRFLPFGVWFYPFKRKTGGEPNVRRRR